MEKNTLEKKLQLRLFRQLFTAGRKGRNNDDQKNI
jgi:hypothetical protein